MPDQPKFVSLVKDALRHLYDYSYLENHPLALQFLELRWSYCMANPAACTPGLRQICARLKY